MSNKILSFQFYVSRSGEEEGKKETLNKKMSLLKSQGSNRKLHSSLELTILVLKTHRSNRN